MFYTCGRFHSLLEKGLRLPRELYQNRNLTQEMAASLMYEKIFCLDSRLTDDMCNTNACLAEYQKFCTSHLQVGELLLLMGDGLLHQHTLNALFHGILLCLEENYSL